MADFYETLGVSRNATDTEIKRAYKKLARKLHPDVAGPGHEDEFKAVNEAYTVLSDPEKKRMYDAGGEQALHGGGFDAAGFGGAFSDIFSSFFGGGAASGPTPRGERGRDRLERITISLKDAVFGTKRDIKGSFAEQCPMCHGEGTAPGTHPTTCDQCGGSGSVRQVTNSLFGRMVSTSPCPKCGGHGTVITTPCPTCNAEGRVRAEKSIPVDIRAGIETGMRIRMSGQGDAGIQGGAPGDLYIAVSVRPDPIFRRAGDDLLAEVTIPMTSAALGAEISVDTFDGAQKVKIPAGTSSGFVAVLPGLGTGHLRGEGRGDMRIAVVVETPSDLTGEQRKLLRKLAELRGEQATDASMSEENQGFFARLREKFAR